MKKRLDLLMVERALAPSREKAKAYIMRFAQKHEMQDCNPAFHPAKMNCRATAEILQNCR